MINWLVVVALGIAGDRQGADELTFDLSGNYHRPAITTNPLGDDSCTKCHGKALTSTTELSGRVVK